MSTNVLFTSAGRRTELIKAFRTAYRTLALEGQVIAIDSDPLAPALQFSDRAYVTPSLDSPEYIPALVEICRREGVSAVFPLVDADISVLARNREAFEAIGTRLAVVCDDAAEICKDKALQIELFDAMSLKTPKTWLAGELDPATAAYPLFIKPRSGTAVINAFKVINAQELVFFSNYVPCAIVQEFLPGPEITNDVICDLDGDFMAIVLRQRIEVRWGEVSKGVTLFNQEIVDACRKIANALPAAGPITIQCMMKGAEPYFTEINARLGGGVPLGIAAGRDSPAMLLARIAGRPIELPPAGSYRTGCYMTRCDNSLTLSEAEYEEMASRHI
jgi:carbamoyl-phosphate synthase large subunit